MSNIAMFNPSNVPAFAKNAELSATTLALAGNVNAGAFRDEPAPDAHADE